MIEAQPYWSFAERSPANPWRAPEHRTAPSVWEAMGEKRENDGQAEGLPRTASKAQTLARLKRRGIDTTLEELDYFVQEIEQDSRADYREISAYDGADEELTYTDDAIRFGWAGNWISQPKGFKAHRPDGTPAATRRSLLTSDRRKLRFRYVPFS